MDPVTGSKWDVSDPMVQSKVWKVVRRDKPLVIGLSPECTLFSALQNLRKNEIPPEELERAMGCVRFCVEIAKFQMVKRRFFYFEHPLSASSWNMVELAELLNNPEVANIVLHMCAFGLESDDAEGIGLVKKPTRVLTNMPSIASAIDRQCSRDHRHVHLMSGRAKVAAHHSEDFCNAIIDGIKTHMEYETLAMACGALNICMGDLENVEEEFAEDFPFSFNDDGWCIDDVRGGELPMGLVREGRKAEIRGFHERGVYEIRLRYDATRKGARVVGVRWVDTMKNSSVRSRLVCQDFNNDRTRTDEMFAPTPFLCASKWLCSYMASESGQGSGEASINGAGIQQVLPLRCYEEGGLH